MSETSPFKDAPELIPVEHVSAVRAVAMAQVRHHARRVKVSAHEPRAHRFVLFDNSGGEVGSDLTDTFLDISVGRSGYRQHMMRISFLELLLSEAERYSNYREVYMFDWQEGERVFARKKTIEHSGKIIATNTDTNGIISDIVEPRLTETLEPLEAGDCIDLCDRMLAITESIRQKVA